jgi:hypothetical protein
MSDEIPHVQVIEDPLVVYLFVALFALAILLAFAFAFIRRGAHAVQPTEGAEMKSPWSTGSPEDVGPGPGTAGPGPYSGRGAGR